MISRRHFLRFFRCALKAAGSPVDENDVARLAAGPTLGSPND